MQFRCEKGFSVPLSKSDNLRSVLDTKFSLIRENFLTTLFFFGKDDKGKTIANPQIRIRFYELLVGLPLDLKCSFEYKILSKDRNLKDRIEMDYEKALSLIDNIEALRNEFIASNILPCPDKLHFGFARTNHRRHYGIKDTDENSFRITFDSDIRFYTMNDAMDRLIPDTVRNNNIMEFKGSQKGLLLFNRLLDGFTDIAIK